MPPVERSDQRKLSASRTSKEAIDAALSEALGCKERVTTGASDQRRAILL